MGASVADTLISYKRSHSKGGIDLIHQAITGSSTAIGSVGSGSVALHLIQVLHHLSADPHLAGDRGTLTTANGVRGSLAIRTVHRSHSTSSTVLSVAGHTLTFPHLAGLKAFDGHSLTSSVKVSSDCGEVGEGIGQVVCFVRYLVSIGPGRRPGGSPCAASRTVPCSG